VRGAGEAARRLVNPSTSDTRPGQAARAACDGAEESRHLTISVWFRFARGHRGNALGRCPRAREHRPLSAAEVDRSVVSNRPV